MTDTTAAERMCLYRPDVDCHSVSCSENGCSPNERFGLGKWHCDDFLANSGLMQCVRDYLEVARAPAVEQTRPRPPLFATLTRDVTVHDYLGSWDAKGPRMRERLLPKGSRIRVVMASRFGDVGITDDLNAEHGYGARLFLPELHDFGATP
jgi:hypothetical protein